MAPVWKSQIYKLKSKKDFFLYKSLFQCSLEKSAFGSFNSNITKHFRNYLMGSLTSFRSLEGKMLSSGINN